MDWKTFTVQMTQTLIWPSILFYVLIRYHNALGAIFSRLASLKVGGFEFAFGNVLSQAREGQPPISKSGIREIASDDDLEELAKRSPRAAMLEAWLRVENRLQEIATKHAIEPRQPISKLLTLLENRSLIDQNAVSSIRGLINLRNLAVHASDVELTTQKSVDFIIFVRAILFVLSRA